MNRARTDGVAANATALFIVPARFVVHLSRRIEPGIQAIIGKLESFFDDKSGVGEVDDVVFCDPIVIDGDFLRFPRPSDSEFNGFYIMRKTL